MCSYERVCVCMWVCVCRHISDTVLFAFLQRSTGVWGKVTAMTFCRFCAVTLAAPLEPGWGTPCLIAFFSQTSGSCLWQAAHSVSSQLFHTEVDLLNNYQHDMGYHHLSKSYSGAKKPPQGPTRITLEDSQKRAPSRHPLPKSEGHDACFVAITRFVRRGESSNQMSYQLQPVQSDCQESLIFLFWLKLLSKHQLQCNVNEIRPNELSTFRPQNVFMLRVIFSPIGFESRKKTLHVQQRVSLRCHRPTQLVLSAILCWSDQQIYETCPTLRNRTGRFTDDWNGFEMFSSQITGTTGNEGTSVRTARMDLLSFYNWMNWG